jgi:hypothetical protein
VPWVTAETAGYLEGEMMVAEVVCDYGAVQAVRGLSISQAECPGFGAPVVVFGAPLVVNGEAFTPTSSNLRNILMPGFPEEVPVGFCPTTAKLLPKSDR